MSVEVRLNTRATAAEVQAAQRRLLARVAAETAQGAAQHAERKSGFLASTIGSTPPGGAGQPGAGQAVAQPAASLAEAYVYVAAAYALYVELKHPFLLPAAAAALATMDRLCAEEGV